MPKYLLPAPLVLLLLVAGCSALASDGGDEAAGQSVTVSLSNQHDASYAVRIVLASGDLEGVRVTYENVSTRTYEVPNVSALPPASTTSATDLDPLGDDLRSERFVVEPDAGIGTTLEGVPRDSRLVYVVSRTGENATLRSRGTSRCAGTDASHSFSLEIDADGAIAVSTRCADVGTPTDG